METIIQQITLKLVEKINKKAFSEELSDLDNLAAELFEDCAEYARLMLQEIIRVRNLQLREDKQFRKEEGLVLKEKDRPRQLLTKLEMIYWERDLDYSQVNRHKFGNFFVKISYLLQYSFSFSLGLMSPNEP